MPRSRSWRFPNCRVPKKQLVQQLEQSSRLHQRHQVSYWSVVGGFSVNSCFQSFVRMIFSYILIDFLFLLIHCFATVEAFRQTDTNYLNEENGHQKDAGSTATTALLVGDWLLVANVGDSRAVACRSGLGLLSFSEIKVREYAVTVIEVHVGQ